MFKQRLPNTLGDAAMDLASQHLWINHHAKIINNGKAFQCHRATSRVNFHLGNMTSIRIGRTRRFIAMGNIQQMRLACHRQRFHQIFKIDGMIGVFNDKQAIFKAYLVFARLQRLRRIGQSGGDDFCRRLGSCRPQNSGHPGAASGAAQPAR